LRVAAHGGHLAVERHGRLEDHQRPAGAGVLAERLVEQPGAHRRLAVGDRDLDPAAEAVVAAAREAMTNAAKFGGGSTVDVYAECGDGRLQVFVRDRGPGFDPEAIPADRRGVRESIVGRMERHGGRATITSAPGAGTEVELMLHREEK
jgi:signal transduction histidine kinase